MKKAYLFDWGNTIMKDFQDEKGKMHTWRKVEAMPNVEKMLKVLTKKADCYLATNAKDSNKQNIMEALQRVGLHVYFKDIFCYREIGFAKPSKEYYNKVLQKLNLKSEDVIMTGDNLENDVFGAEDNGIEAILYDPDDHYKKYNGKRITDHLELLRII